MEKPFLVKDLTAMRATGVRMTKSQFCNTYGVDEESVGSMSVMCYIDGPYFIEIHEDKCTVNVCNVTRHGTLLECEIALWDTFIKGEFGPLDREEFEQGFIDELEGLVDKAFEKAQEKIGYYAGEMSPEQSEKLDELQASLLKLIADVGYQNL